jgi:sigma-B regulation protein RsbU (phosphoserine phosphatase)
MIKQRFVFLLTMVFVLGVLRLLVVQRTYFSTGAASDGSEMWLLRFANEIWVPVLMLGAGAFVGLLRPQDPHAFRASQMFLWFSWMVRSWDGTLPPGLTAVADTLSSFAAIVAVPYFVMAFFLKYPSRSVIDAKAPWILWVAPVVSMSFWLLAVLPRIASLSSSEMARSVVANLPVLDRRTPLEIALFAFISLEYAVAMTALGFSRGRAQSPDERRRLALINLGVGAATLSLFAAALSFRLGLHLPPDFFAVLALLMGLFPVTFVYVVLRDRVFGIRLILRRGLQYALVSRGFLLLQGLLVFYLLFMGARGLVRVQGQHAPFVPAAAAAIAVGVVFSLGRVTQRVIPWIDRRFFREAYDEREVLVDLSRAVRRLGSKPDELLFRVTHQVVESLHPSFAAVYLRDQPWPQLQPVPGAPPAGQGEDRWLAFASFRPGNGTAPPPAVPLEALQHLLATGEAYSIPVREGAGPAEAAESCRLLVPLHGSGKLLGFLGLGDKLSEEPYSPEDRELLMTVTEQAATALENVQLFSQLADQEKLQREVEIAKEVQAQLFPKVLPKLDTLAYLGSCRQARAVGGDYYDFLALAPGRVGIALGDIAGKGISAALLMATLQALLRSHAPLRGHDLAALVGTINRLLYESTDSARYATFFYGVYEDSTRRLSYVNAGHVPPVLVRANGAAPSVERLTTGGLVIGLMPDPVYESATVELRKGDALLIFSDGVSEAESTSGDMYGDERAGVLAAGCPELSAHELHDRVLDEVFRFATGMPQADDTTLIVARGL